jgi:hypothetical protein
MHGYRHRCTNGANMGNSEIHWFKNRSTPSLLFVVCEYREAISWHSMQDLDQTLKKQLPTRKTATAYIYIYYIGASPHKTCFEDERAVLSELTKYRIQNFI